MKLHLDPSDRPAFTFCEASSAPSHSRWHIRRIPDGEAPKYTGGITTDGLCGKPDVRGWGGWDLAVVITEHHLGHACQMCVAKYKESAR